MIILLVLLGIGSVVGIVATVIELRRDGYRRIPNRPEYDFGPIREEQSATRPLWGLRVTQLLPNGRTAQRP